MRQPLRGNLAGEIDHTLGDIRAGDCSVVSDGLCGREGDQPGAASHIEHLLARLQAGHLQQALLGRGELPLPGVFAQQGRFIPAVALHPFLQSCVHYTTSLSLMCTFRRRGVPRENMSK